MEEKILGLYACGMSQMDIAEQIKSLYDVEISPELVGKISEKIMPEVSAWQNRALETVYPFVFMDAIHYKVKKPSIYYQNSLRCSRNPTGWKEGHFGCLDRRKLEQQVLAFRAQ